MKIFDIVQHPVIKTIGIIMIIYFALFKDKSHPDSLGNRLSPSQIKQDIDEVKKKSFFILHNVNKVQEINNHNLETKAEDEIVEEKISEGSGRSISCGDNVQFSYKILNKDHEELYFSEIEKITIGDDLNRSIDQYITGMKQYGIKNIQSKMVIKIKDEITLKKHLTNQEKLYHYITILSIEKPDNKPSFCNS